MADWADPPGFRTEYPDRTTTTTSNTQVRTDLRFDKTYVQTLPGILKVAQIVLNLLGFICIEISYFSTHARGSFFNFVAMTGFWFTGALLLFYLFHVIEKFYRIPWLKIELGFCALWVLFYLIASCLAATFGPDAFAAAAFFGFCAMAAYGADAYFKLRAVQRGEIAQGERVVQKTVSAVTSPTATY